LKLKSKLHNLIEIEIIWAIEITLPQSDPPPLNHRARIAFWGRWKALDSQTDLGL